LPRSRLRAHLAEVIADADLRARIDQVVGDPTPPAEDPATLAAPSPAAGLASPPPLAFVATAQTLNTAPPTPIAAGSASVAGNGTAAHVGSPTAISGGPAHTEALHTPRRRRRSASLLPPLPSPADLAEDAPGRVELITISPPADLTPPADPPEHIETAVVRPLAPVAPAAPIQSVAPVPSVAAAFSARVPRGDAVNAWLPVAFLGIALLLIFIVGMVVTR
jgi:hypothetical protein